MIILEGAGNFAWGDSRVEYSPAQVWMIPAMLGAFGMTLMNYTGIYALVTLGLVLLTGVGGLRHWIAPGD